MATMFKGLMMEFQVQPKDSTRLTQPLEIRMTALITWVSPSWSVYLEQFLYKTCHFPTIDTMQVEMFVPERLH